MPIFVWTAFATAHHRLTATQLIGLSFQMVMFERLFGMGFFNPNQGGEPDLVPAPVLVLLPPGGVCFRPDRIGRDQRAAAGVRSQTSLWLPVGGHVFPGIAWSGSSCGLTTCSHPVWPATCGCRSCTALCWLLFQPASSSSAGQPLCGAVKAFETPMLFVLGAISIFLLGGLSGPPNATVATDLHLHRYLFHRRSLPRHDVRWVCIPVLRRDLLLVPQDDRADV
jgi:cytochrome c oxidase subunit I